MDVTNIPTILAQYQYEAYEPTAGEAAGIMALLGVLMLPIIILVVIYIISMWKIFTKAGQPGWAAIVPVYNIIVQLNVQGRPAWWVIWWLIPFVNYVSTWVMMIITGIDLSKRFGKSGGFAAGIILLPFIFLPILAFGSSQYQAAPTATALPAGPPAGPPAGSA